MRLHRPIAEQIIQAIDDVFVGGYYADRVIERLFKKNRQLGARDRKQIAESVYEIVRWWRKIWFVLDREVSFEKSELWKVLGAWLTLHDGETLPSWKEFSELDPALIKSRAKYALRTPAVAQSLPDWLYELGLAELGEKWNEWLPELNRQAPVCLRANRLKTTRDALKEKLLSDGIETDLAPMTDDGLILRERRNVFTNDSFKSGWFEVQDGASQQIAPMLDLLPGLRVIDACAGAGGKTLHAAALMKNKGKIVSMDVVEKKLEELRRRSSRGGIDIVETKLIESQKTIKRFDASADRVLLDVPCSGLGVLRRNPDAKWKLKMEDIEQLRATQRDILENYSRMVKVGGRLVYATCSILPSENEKQVEVFLQAHPGQWKLLSERKFRPGENGYDGFYAAALERES